MRAPILISYASKDRSAAGTVENAREPVRLRAAEVQPEDASPSNRSGPRQTKKRSDRSPIALCLAVVMAFAVAISPSSGMSETTPPHAGSPAPEISAAEALRKAREAYDRRDYAEAMRWLRQAADQGNATAQVKIGQFYSHGWGAAQDYSDAMRWYRMAADQGDAFAQNNVGWLYENGWGVAQDYSEAMRWYREAADRGDAYAQNKVGWFYYNGWGVKQDYGEAMRWFCKAADQGDALAQNNIGWMYAKGQGVPRDLSEARAWIQRAAAGGYEDAKQWLAAH
jgi:TPR repeat protein